MRSRLSSPPGRRLAILLTASLGLSSLALPQAHARDGTLYDQLGGHDAVARIADGAMTLYFSDPRLSGDFDNINRAWLQPRFASFICHVAGGPCAYKGRSMAASHRGLHITEARFLAVVEDLETAMNDAGVPFRVQNRLLARLAPMERDIVTR